MKVLLHYFIQYFSFVLDENLFYSLNEISWSTSLNTTYNLQWSSELRQDWYGKAETVTESIRPLRLGVIPLAYEDKGKPLLMRDFYKVLSYSEQTLSASFCLSFHWATWKPQTNLWCKYFHCRSRLQDNARNRCLISCRYSWVLVHEFLYVLDRYLSASWKCNLLS